MNRPRITSQRATRLAFGVIVLFLLAQVAWWIIFQQRYIARVTGETVSGWERDAATATQLYAARPRAAVRGGLEADYPHLRFGNGRFAIDPADLQAFRAEQTAMFAIPSNLPVPATTSPIA